MQNGRREQWRARAAGRSNNWKVRPPPKFEIFLHAHSVCVLGRCLMQSTEEGVRRRRKSQGGHEILETALTMALFFGFMFLIIDISMAVFIKGSLQTAVEEGVRTGITETLLSGTSYLSD